MSNRGRGLGWCKDDKCWQGRRGSVNIIQKLLTPIVNGPKLFPRAISSFITPFKSDKNFHFSLLFHANLHSCCFDCFCVIKCDKFMTITWIMNSKVALGLPAGIYLLKVNRRNTRTRCEICSKLTIKIPERRQSFWYLYC